MNNINLTFQQHLENSGKSANPAQMRLQHGFNFLEYVNYVTQKSFQTTVFHYSHSFLSYFSTGKLVNTTLVSEIVLSSCQSTRKILLVVKHSSPDSQAD